MLMPHKLTLSESTSVLYPYQYKLSAIYPEARKVHNLVNFMNKETPVRVNSDVQHDQI
jgi:hypothetical protein